MPAAQGISPSRRLPGLPMLLMGALLAVVIGLVWIMALREGDRRGLVVEYEAFKASATLAEELRRTDPSTLSVQDPRIRGFGLYSLKGTALKVTGTAPDSLDMSGLPFLRGRNQGGAFTGAPELRVEKKASSVVIYRFLGPQSVARQMMQGGARPAQDEPPAQGRTPSPGQAVDQDQAPGMGQGQMRGMAWRRQVPGIAQPGMAAAMPLYLLWLEFDSDGAFIEAAVYIGIAASVTAAMVALFAVILRLFARNERMRERENQTRELVQLGEAARTLVHEIKNPLGIMRIQTAGIRRQLAAIDPEPSKARLAAIGASATLIDAEIRRLAGLADRIREFLQAGEGNADRILLDEFLASFSERYVEGDKDEGRISLVLEPGTEGAVAAIDRERLTLALDNLVNNAREANIEAGRDGGAVVLRLGARGRDWVISVEDSGEGVAREIVERIFEPFFTTKHKGSGIGLALARRIAEGAAGTLSYAPGESGGAVFTIGLPKS